MLDRGSIVETGNHDELMALEGHYYRLYQAQLQNAEDDSPAGPSAGQQDKEDRE